MLDYIRSYRETDVPYDVAMGVVMPPDAAQARDIAQSYEAAGATWLQEWQPGPDALSKRLRALPAQFG